ncbi:MAG TPA: hypothetical protein VME22_08465 [Solirubrobacteraceae bacterium]|nr:hypothetical protein [Solirubrobacteraceae bacterium]
MSEDLGSAELDLGANLLPLDADLKRAEARVAASLAAMQALVDAGAPKIEARFSEMGAVMEAALAGPLSRLDEVAKAAGNTTVVGGSTGGTNIKDSSTQLWGVRGTEHVGSVQNPLAFVLLASIRHEGLSEACWVWFLGAGRRELLGRWLLARCGGGVAAGGVRRARLRAASARPAAHSSSGCAAR